MTHLADLITTVREETAALRKRIEEEKGTLRDLERQLQIHERIAAMLQGDTTATKTPSRATRKQTAKTPKKSAAKKKTGRKKRATRTNWNAVLQALPSSFTAGQAKEAAGNRANSADVHQALLRWRKAGTITTSGRGQYGKT